MPLVLFRGTGLSLVGELRSGGGGKGWLTWPNTSTNTEMQSHTKISFCRTAPVTPFLVVRSPYTCTNIKLMLGGVLFVL